MDSPPLFSIITPSFQSSSWLKLCIASVADQGVPVEHIVQDAGSTDGTLEWLPQDRRVHAYVEKDEGMYDAVNRGLKRAQGSYLAYLNCDEQYLPGTLQKVASFFEAHPEVDLVFGHIIVIRENGDYFFHRRVLPPQLPHTWTVHLATLTCAMFFRREWLLRNQLWFNPQWKQGGDGEWMVRVLQNKTRMGVIPEFLSVFTATGANQSNSPGARLENRRLAASAPTWMRWGRPAWILLHRLRKWRHGLYSRQSPFSYALYTRESSDARVVRRADHPTTRWQCG